VGAERGAADTGEDRSFVFLDRVIMKLIENR